MKEDVTLGEIFKIAEEQVKAAGGNVNQIHCMIWGRLTKVYDVPMTVLPTPAFTRGFTRVAEDARIGDAPAIDAGSAEPNKVVVVENYQKRMSELE